MNESTKKNICFYSVNTQPSNNISRIFNLSNGSKSECRYHSVRMTLSRKVVKCRIRTSVHAHRSNTLKYKLSLHLQKSLIFPRYQGQLRTLSAKLAHCSFKTLGILGFGGFSDKFPCRLFDNLKPKWPCLLNKLETPPVAKITHQPLWIYFHVFKCFFLYR